MEAVENKETIWCGLIDRLDTNNIDVVTVVATWVREDQWNITFTIQYDTTHSIIYNGDEPESEVNVKTTGIINIDLFEHDDRLEYNNASMVFVNVYPDDVLATFEWLDQLKASEITPELRNAITSQSFRKHRN